MNYYIMVIFRHLELSMFLPFYFSRRIRYDYFLAAICCARRLRICYGSGNCVTTLTFSLFLKPSCQ